jgi:hypothetical protein
MVVPVGRKKGSSGGKMNAGFGVRRIRWTQVPWFGAGAWLLLGACAEPTTVDPAKVPEAAVDVGSGDAESDATDSSTGGRGGTGGVGGSGGSGATGGNSGAAGASSSDAGDARDEVADASGEASVDATSTDTSAPPDGRADTTTDPDTSGPPDVARDPVIDAPPDRASDAIIDASSDRADSSG